MAAIELRWVLSSAFLSWSLAGLAGAAELPTARPADVGLSAERLERLDPEEDLVLILMSQYMVADADFAARFQTLAYQAIVD
jgi:hypothetical protein